MYGGIIKLVAKAGRKSELVEFLRWDAEYSKEHEPGTLRFDVWDAASEENAVYMYEAYADEAASDVHRGNEPYKRYMEEIGPNVVESVTLIVPFADSLASTADD